MLRRGFCGLSSGMQRINLRPYGAWPNVHGRPASSFRNLEKFYDAATVPTPNPDLPRRIRDGLSLNTPAPSTFFGNRPSPARMLVTEREAAGIKQSEQQPFQARQLHVHSRTDTITLASSQRSSPTP
jgi:hypothetical protein